MFERFSSALAIESWSLRDLKRVPNLLSLSRIVLAGVFPLTLGHPWWSLAVLATAGLTDVLDGWYARRTHQESAIGVVVDAIADKLFVICIILALLATHRLSIGDVLLLGVRDIGEMALALRLFVADEHLVGHSPNVGGKLTTVLQYAALVAVIFGSPVARILIVLAAVTGVMATIAYWRRETHSQPCERSKTSS